MILSLLLHNFAVLAALFFCVWLASIPLKDVSIIDIFWGPGCALPAVTTWLFIEGASPRATLLTALVSLWGLRLGLYLARRNLGHGEDFRYVKMREKTGPAFAWLSLPRIFLVQCSIAFFVSLPVQLGQLGDDAPLGPLALIGAAIFVIGLIFETIGDAQLRAFKKDPANTGKIMDQGLWAYTRHPNYFGDACVWTGLTLIALEGPFGIYTMLSPMVMIFFLYAVSGKAMLERAMTAKYPAYAAYKSRVSGFFPCPTRQKKNS